jgi:adenylosuccinate lyase
MLLSMTTIDTLQSISPIDGRYRAKVAALANYFSEQALMQYRLKVEVEYLIALAKEKGVKELRPFTVPEQKLLRKVYQEFNLAGAQAVKQIEATTHHDVKAIEYYIKQQLKPNILPF